MHESAVLLFCNPVQSTDGCIRFGSVLAAASRLASVISSLTVKVKFVKFGSALAAASRPASVIFGLLFRTKVKLSSSGVLSLLPQGQHQ